jgi:hypothetical protein
MTLIHYRLRGREIEEVYSLKEWARWFEKSDRRVALTQLPDGIEVSTVFLGLDHNFGMNGPPILFETMVFGPAEETSIFGRIRMSRPELNIEGAFARYATYDDAEAGHARIVKLMTDAIGEIAAQADAVVSRILSSSIDRG